MADGARALDSVSQPCPDLSLDTHVFLRVWDSMTDLTETRTDKIRTSHLARRTTTTTSTSSTVLAGVGITL